MIVGKVTIMPAAKNKDGTIRQKIRKSVGVKHTGVPVHIIPDSFQTPVLSGEPGGYFTYGGAKIIYPSGYSKKGWSNMYYRCSTLSISVGSEYIRKIYDKN